MSIDAIAGFSPVSPVNMSNAAAETGGTDFSTWLSREMSALNSQLENADSLVQQLAVGKNTNLHQIMMGLEQAKLSFELAVQVRNKLLEGYQEIMRMQI